MNLFFRWFVLTIAVWVATLMVPHVSYDHFSDLLIAALVLGVLNALVRPLLQLISLPFIILSLGLFLLVINALLLGLTSTLVPGFHVDGTWAAVGGSVVISIVSLFLGYPRDSHPQSPRFSRWRSSRATPADTPPLRRKGPPPGKGPIIDV